MTDGGEQPDFVTLYPAGHPGWTLTPRMACSLWITATVLADMWRENLDDPRYLLQDLPVMARPLADPLWLRRFVRCFEDLAGRLATGNSGTAGLASCTGDEMAVHLILDLAEAQVADGTLLGDPTLSSPPRMPGGDADFDAAREMLLVDHDVLALFDPSVDGIEDPEVPTSAHMRVTNLHPRDLFKPFGLDDK